MVKKKKQLPSVELAIPATLLLIDFAFEQGASDPLNPVKFWILGIFGIWAFSRLLAKFHNFSPLKTRNPKVLFTRVILGFAFFLFVGFLGTSVKSVGLLGDTGRNLGFLNYLLLSIMAIYAANHFSYLNIKNIYWTVFTAGTCLSVYGLLQHFRLDFLKWNNPNNSVILMTGNPDFAASLLAIVSVVSFAGLFLDFPRAVKVLMSFIIALSAVDIYWTNALQGLVGLLIGGGFAITVLVWRKNKAFGLTLAGLESIVGVVSILGAVQIGPMAKFLYKASVNDRGYNWRAAINMFKNYPITGVGLDRYGAYFLQYRSPEYPLKYGYTQSVTNAHNVFLQIFATAGVFAGLTYVAIIGFIGYRAFMGIRNTSGNQQIIFTGLVAGWVVFVAQSFISVDALVISIWGWSLGGIIVTLSFTSAKLVDSKNKDDFSAKKTKLNKTRRIFSFWVVFPILLSLFTFFVIVPSHRNETSTARFLRISAPSTSQGQEIYKRIAQSTFNGLLLSPNYKSAIAAKMAENNYGPESIAYFKETLKADPRNTNSYSLLSLVYENLKKPEAAIPYRKMLAKLDPYGAENLLALERDYLVTGEEHLAIAAENTISAIAPGSNVAARASSLINSKSSVQVK